MIKSLADLAGRVIVSVKREDAESVCLTVAEDAFNPQEVIEFTGEEGVEVCLRQWRTVTETRTETICLD